MRMMATLLARSTDRHLPVMPRFIDCRRPPDFSLGATALEVKSRYLYLNCGEVLSMHAPEVPSQKKDFQSLRQRAADRLAFNRQLKSGMLQATVGWKLEWKEGSRSIESL